MAPFIVAVRKKKKLIFIITIITVALLCIHKSVGLISLSSQGRTSESNLSVGKKSGEDLKNDSNKTVRVSSTSTLSAPSPKLKGVKLKKVTFLDTFKRECGNYRRPNYGWSMDIPVDQEYCPCVPTGLVGHKIPNLDEPSWEELETAHPEVETGGHWSPSNCTSRQRTCLLVPYRDREVHLKIWLKNMIPFLQKQYLNFTIFVAEQNNASRFNRGMLINVAFIQAIKLGVKCECVIIHDVDHVPEDDRIMYFCQKTPIHLALTRDSNGYKLPYRSFIGGAMAIEARQFKSHNGFSNLYFGWGSEDDDMYERITKGIRKHVKRYPADIAKYTMIRHVHAEPNKGRFLLVKSWRRRWYKDGVNNAMERCLIDKIEKKKLFTHIFIAINEEIVKEGTGYSLGLLENSTNRGAYLRTDRGKAWFF